MKQSLQQKDKDQNQNLFPLHKNEKRELRRIKGEQI